ncbi:MAG: S-layer homology domain-containing protein, partial [Anaerolineales bacterium]|nr:S-layer homology domain-containing protein [Anaerolineales bacterium]
VLYGSPANVTVETTAPTVLSFTRQSPSGSLTNANTLIFRVTFREDVSGVGLADFALSGTTAELDDCSTVNASVYDIEVNGTDSVNDGDLVSYNGVVGLNFSGSMSITDLAGNPLANIEPATDETYTLDNSAPVITINNPDTSAATSKTITASASDGTLTMSITIGSTCDGTLTFIAYSDQTFSTEADNGKRVCYKAVDAVGNTTYSLSDAIAGIDTTITAPVVSSITRASTNPTSASSVDFTVTFSKSVTGVDVNDFILTTSGLTGASISAVSGSGASYIVTAATGYKPGTLRLDIPNTATITDLSSNSLAGLPFTAGESYTVNKSPTFSDVPFDYWSWPYIESILNAGITGGCSSNPLSFCPTQSVTRAQMAVFILKGIHGQSFTPPSINSNTGFDDVASDYWAAAWIKQLAAEGITGGCGNGNYCPENTVTRDQMAVFLLKAKYGSSYTPPAVNGNTGFSDVPADYWAAAWIKQLAAEAITGGCGGGNYCPSNPVTRDQMAVFLQKTFGLPLP